MRSRLAQWRVPLGFVCGAIALYFARPTPASILAGMAIATAGEALRLWASGHLEKGREITRSGPYGIVRHPLYLGSAIMGMGFVIASRSVIVAILVLAYVVATLGAAMATEEASLEQRFAGEYAAYREGRAEPVSRTFSLARVQANREYRAVAGLVAAWVLLYLRSA